MKELVVLLLAAACGGQRSTASGDSGAAGTPDGALCVRAPAVADRVRHVVISHPFDASGEKANTWEVLDLSVTGELSRPGRTFEMGYADVGEVVFTRDGQIGVATQEDGTLGVFALDAGGVPTVLERAFKGSFYATRVVAAPSGELYVLDTQWREHGGGIYELGITCEGHVRDLGLVTPAKLPAALAFTSSGTWVVAAHDVASSAAGTDVHLVQPAGLTLRASADAFPDDLQIVGGATLTHDGSAFLVGDTSQYGDAPNRVAIVPVEGTSLGMPAMIPNVEDPLALLASPFADRVLVVSGFGDAMFQLVKTNGTWTNAGELAYQGAKPQLPSGAVMIDAGSLRGLALVAENVGVRRVEMYAAGTIVDRGSFSLGDGLLNATGAIGVTP